MDDLIIVHRITVKCEKCQTIMGVMLHPLIFPDACEEDMFTIFSVICADVDKEMQNQKIRIREIL